MYGIDVVFVRCGEEYLVDHDKNYGGKEFGL